ncbi:hypothetical protein STEG23_036418 [Scotinomys teguina]
MAVMLLPGMKGSPLLIQRKIARTIKLQGSISKGFLKDVFISRKQEEEGEFHNFMMLSLPLRAFCGFRGEAQHQRPPPV